MTPKISVIVPVYNTGEILRDTIDSVLNQTFSDFELILVDDGSIDVSRQICDEYKQKDPRVFVVHQSNKGICAARNVGISLARGQYITFCDHDDLYLPQKLEKQYIIAERTGADIVNVGYEIISDNGRKETVSLKLNCKNKEEIKSNFFEVTDWSFGTIWTKLYRYSSLKDYLFFDTKYTCGHEDINFNLQLLEYINSYYSTDIILYKHVIREKLSTSAKVHIEVVQGMKDEIEHYCNMINFFYLDIKSNRRKYINKISLLVWSISVYMIKCSVKKEEYVRTLSQLCYIPCNIGLMEMLFFKINCIKERLILFLLEREHYNILYYMIKLGYNLTPKK